MYTDIVVILVCVITATILLVITINQWIVSRKVNDILSTEGFIVSDAQDFHNYNTLKNQVLTKPDSFAAELINNPPADQVVAYEPTSGTTSSTIALIDNGTKIDTTNSKKTYITAADFGWDAPFPVVSCANSSIDSRFRSGPKKLLPSIGCGFPNKLTAENYYKTHYMAQAIPLEDYAVRGANYNQYSDYIHPTKSNIRILSQNTKGLPPDETTNRNIPTGFGFAFHNTPAMRMP